MTKGTQTPGFALPIVMVALAGLIILLVGMMTLVKTERRIAGKFSDSYRAELAAYSGLAEVDGLLRELTQTDDYLVLKRDLIVETNGESHPRPYYYLAKPKTEELAEDPQYTLEPLFSTSRRLDPLSIDTFRAREISRQDSSESILLAEVPLPEDEASDGPAADELRDRDELANIPVQAWQYQPIVQWQPIYDDLGEGRRRKVARYAYWIEDLEGYIDPMAVGNLSSEGLHTQKFSDAPIPGQSTLSELDDDDLVKEFPAFESAALHTLFDGQDEDEGGSQIDDRLIELRERMTSSASEVLEAQLGVDQVVAFSGEKLPLERVANPSVKPVTQQNDPRRFLKNETSRALEETITLMTRGYDEQALIPYLRGISPAAMGQSKLNLNKLLSGNSFIEDFSKHVQEALPDFAGSRKGGFPEDYVRTLAAGAKDYADEDNDVTVSEGTYRGLDGFPIVSEVAFRINLSRIYNEDGQKIVEFQAQPYLELWNMTNQSITGRFQMSYETRYSAAIGPVPDFELGSAETLLDSGTANHGLSLVEGDWRFPAQTLTLQPNEYALVSGGEVSYRVEAGPASFFIRNITFGGDDGSSGYKVWWNGNLIDHSRGGLERADIILNRGGSRQRVRANIPAHSHGKAFSSDFINNMGDPRMTYYISATQTANGYPRNWSPWRRNVRREIFGRRNGERNVFTRVFPSEWPDGGHDSDFGNDRYPSNAAQQLNPDDLSFARGKPVTEPSKAPMYLSNRGRFYSAAELGNVYDPVMWDTQAGTNRPEEWLDIDDRSVASPNHGGGNTLRVGRAEHSRFDEPGSRASHVLDLFHAGKPLSVDEQKRRGPLVRRRGHINVNTASREALRVMMAGRLVADPDLAQGRPGSVDKRKKIPRVRPFELGTPVIPDDLEAKAAGLVADAIIRNRPYASLSKVVNITTRDGEKIFGNKEIYENGEGTQWNDRAAEELFGRLFTRSTVRSRNFRVYVIGQSLDPLGRVLSTHKRVVTLFADPGEREEDGSIIPRHIHIKHIHDREN